ncbi:MAG TPA: acyl-CoA thioester hydrolase/BAAT C-terminal domain-containing protein [Gaiellaceae bacterium]|nr:acyl-CoA thioester hydrolase/BAAT C-terminal domain-containing protein [Gaiellaceae bacterium]
MRHLVVCLVLVILAGCGGGSKDESTDIYAYDAGEPIAKRDAGLANSNYPIKIHDISFDGGAERVPAFLLLPPGKGPYPAVIYLHGQGGDRLEMLYTASWLAARRAAALTVESPYSPNREIKLGTGVAGLRKERNRTVQGVVELRRAVDLLQSLPQVDDDRIGFVGYSAGARTGAILAGVERRIKAYVFMSGGEDSVDEFMSLVPSEQQDEVRPLLEDTDGLRYIAQASPSKLFFQAGRKDEIVPRDALRRLIEAGSEPKKVAWYDAGHNLAVPRAQRDQLEWLSEVLEIEGPPVEGAETGP